MNKDEIIAELLKYANHDGDCDSRMPMWHKGPCDCGFASLVVKLRAQGVNIKDGSIEKDAPQPPPVAPSPPASSMPNVRVFVDSAGYSAAAEQVSSLERIFGCAFTLVSRRDALLGTRLYWIDLFTHDEDVIRRAEDHFAGHVFDVKRNWEK